MKNTKKLLAIMLTVMMIVSLFTVNTSALVNNSSEFKWDFQAEEIGAGSPGSGMFTSTQIPNVGDSGLLNPGPTNYATVVADPAGVEGNKVLQYNFTSAYYSSGCIQYYHAHMNGIKVAFSFKYYFPETGNLPLRAEWIPTGQNIELFLFSNAGMTVCGNTLKDANGDNLSIIKGAWNTCTIVLDDSRGTGEAMLVDTYINGNKALSGANVININGDVVTGPLASSGYDKVLRFYSKGTGTAYLDDIEARRATGWGSLLDAPTATIDDNHKGDEVLVSAKEIDFSFVAGTDNLMDTSTYKDNISVNAGAIKLSEGTDYTVSYSDLKNVKITLTNDMAYNTNYTVAVSDAVKTVAGVSAPATFTFKTERKQGDDNSAPTAMISGIKDKTRFDIGEAINFSVSALDNDGDAIKFVKIYSNGEEVASKSEAPYNFSISTLGEGTHVLSVVATDEKDAAGEAATITVIVKGNTATILEPSIKNGYIFWNEGDVTLSADAYDADGEALSAVSISVDGGAAQEGVFSANIADGEHTAKFTVTDSRGNTYEKEATFTYRPTFRPKGVRSSYDFDTTDMSFSDAAGVVKEKIKIDDNRGNALAFSATSDVAAGANPAFESTWDIYGGDTISFDFMAEDVSAQNIRFVGYAGGWDTFPSTVKIINGKITNTETGQVYGTIESGKWYKADIILDSVGTQTIYNIAGYSFAVKYERSSTDLLYRYRAFRFFPYEAVAGGSNGKKLYIDNIKDTGARKLNDIRYISAFAEDGTEYKGDFFKADAKYFVVTIEQGIPEGEKIESTYKLYKNGVEVPCTLQAYDELKQVGSYKYFTQVKFTPTDANAIEAGAKYTFEVWGKCWCLDEDTLWGSTQEWSDYKRRVDMVACESDMNIENAGLYEGNIKIDKIANIAGDGVTFNVDITNVSGEDKTMYVIAAAYSGNRMLDIQVETVTVKNGKKETFKTAAVKKAGANVIKGFIWGTDNKPFANNVFAD